MSKLNSSFPLLQIASMTFSVFQSNLNDFTLVLWRQQNPVSNADSNVKFWVKAMSEWDDWKEMTEMRWGFTEKN